MSSVWFRLRICAQCFLLLITVGCTLGRSWSSLRWSICFFFEKLFVRCFTMQTSREAHQSLIGSRCIIQMLSHFQSKACVLPPIIYVHDPFLRAGVGLTLSTERTVVVTRPCSLQVTGNFFKIFPFCKNTRVSTRPPSECLQTKQDHSSALW